MRSQAINKATSQWNLKTITRRLGRALYPAVFRFHDGTAVSLRRLTKRPNDYQELDGCFYVSGSGKDAVIYIYAAKFSTYAVATSDVQLYSAGLNGASVSITLDGYSGGTLMAVSCASDGRMLKAVQRRTDNGNLKYEPDFGDVSGAAVIKLFYVSDKGVQPMKDVIRGK